MLGEKIGNFEGRTTSRRVIANPGGGPKVEVSFEHQGVLAGVEMREIGTYQSGMRPDGTVYGEGQGVLMGKGGEAASWAGAGVGSLSPDGSVSFRGALYYQSASPALARLNAVAVVFEYEEDAQGKTRSSLWEWK